MGSRAWLRWMVISVGLAGLVSGCRSAPPPTAAPAAPAGSLCRFQGLPEISETVGSGWSFCVRQQADCTLANAAEAIRLRLCEQSRRRTCLDTGCKKYGAKGCRLEVTGAVGAQVQATPPRNNLCGKGWECTVKTPGGGRGQPPPSLYTCTCACATCDGPTAESPPISKAPLVPLAKGAYAVVVVWTDRLCPNGQMQVSALEGEAFTLTAVGKCLPAGLQLRAALTPAGGAFFAVGDDPTGPGLYRLTGVVEDPDAFTGLLTRTSGPEERIEERIRITGRRMTTTR